MDQTQNVIDVFDSCAKEYQDQFMDISQYRASIDLFCASIKGERPNILELACGPGNITSYLRETHPKYSILGTDISSNMLTLARKNVPSVSFVELDCRNISNISGQFNGIMCGFALPYLSKEEARQMIHDSFELMETEGILYISTMQGNYADSKLTKSSSGKHELFLHYHEKEYLQEALESAGYFVLKMIDLVTTGPNGEANDLVIIAKKQV